MTKLSENAQITHTGKADKNFSRISQYLSEVLISVDIHDNPSVIFDLEVLGCLEKNINVTKSSLYDAVKITKIVVAKKGLEKFVLFEVLSI